MAVTGIEVIIIYTQKPEEGIVHYRIGVTGYGIFATKQIMVRRTVGLSKKR